jgi:hypothetical protein
LPQNRHKTPQRAGSRAASSSSSKANIEQTKFLNWPDLSRLLGKVVRLPPPQRRELERVATQANLEALARFKAQRLSEAGVADVSRLARWRRSGDFDFRECRVLGLSKAIIRKRAGKDRQNAPKSGVDRSQIHSLQLL